MTTNSESPLADSKVASSFSVRDIADARKFYGDVLGVRAQEEYAGRVLRLHLAGGVEVMLYGKEDHEPASFTVLTFTVDDLQAVITTLAGRGVEFERPEGLELDEQNIHHAEGHDIVWIKDPSGNSIEINQDVP
jgi:catechol 2,3-dioxygenase-like lactoylglutathione lyase family enzyme